MNEAVKAAFAVVQKYHSNGRMCVYNIFGDGPYAIVAVFKNGRKLLKGVGFETAADAEIFAAFAEEAAPAAFVRKLCEEGMDPSVAENVANFERFEVVKIEPVISTAAVERVLRGEMP